MVCVNHKIKNTKYNLVKNKSLWSADLHTRFHNAASSSSLCKTALRFRYFARECLPPSVIPAGGKRVTTFCVSDIRLSLLPQHIICIHRSWVPFRTRVARQQLAASCSYSATFLDVRSPVPDTVETRLSGCRETRLPDTVPKCVSKL